MKNVANKVAFVTGGAGGIGLAIARSLGARGARIMLADIDAGQLADAEAGLRAQGIDAAGVTCDVRDAQSVAAAARHTLDRFDKVHIVINNAGVFLGGSTGSIPLEDWRWIVDVNLMGVVHGVETFVPILTAQNEGGYIVNTASMAGHWAIAGLGPYNATKYAVVGYSETIRRELKPLGIAVSVLCPALVRTDIYASIQKRPSGRTVPCPDDRQPCDWMKVGRAATETGIDADIVAEWAVDCMAQRRFYIVTHPEMASIIDARAELLKSDYRACADNPRFAETPTN